jgi:hypothetical protein
MLMVIKNRESELARIRKCNNKESNQKEINNGTTQRQSVSFFTPSICFKLAQMSNYVEKNNKLNLEEILLESSFNPF